MANTDQPTIAELDEVLSRAVERQIAEQRALRNALEELRDAVAVLGSRSPEPALHAVIEELRGSVDALRDRKPEPASAAQVDLSGLDDRVRRSIETGIARLEGELRDVRQAVHSKAEPSLDASNLVSSLADDVRSMSEGVTALSADVDGIAQALIDLNSGLRTWADDVDVSVGALREAVDAVRELTQTRAVAEAGDTLSEAPAPPVLPERGPQVLGPQLKEMADLSLYLTDQIEDLDGVLKRLGELPERVEGVVAQAMRRTLATRAKIEQEAETVFDEVAEGLENSTQRLAAVIDELDESSLRKVTLGHVELTSRVDSMHEQLLTRIEDVSLDQHRIAEAIAQAIDRSARGLEPRAVASLTKASSAKGSTRRRADQKRSTPKKKAKRSPARRTKSTDGAG